MKLDSIRTTKYFSVIFFSLMGFLLIAATDKKAEKVEFDFKETSSYSHELDTRPDFPVAVTFLRNYIYSISALGETIDAKNKDKIIAFAKKIQRHDGGFSIDPATKKTSSLYTDYALESLSYTGALNSINVAGAKAYLASLKRSDGGFGFDVNTKESSLQATYYAVHSLSLIGGLDIADKAKTALYVKGFERKDTGGFSSVKGPSVADPKDTYMAVYVLKALGMLDEGTKQNAIKFLMTTPYVGIPKKYDITQTLEEEAYTLLALRLLDASDKVARDGAIAFVKSFYIPVNGGFGPIHGYGTAPDPTFYGIQSLAELGVLKRPAQSRLK